LNTTFEFFANELFIQLLTLLVIIFLLIWLIFSLQRLYALKTRSSVICLEVGNDENCLTLDWSPLFHPGSSYNLSVVISGIVNLTSNYSLFHANLTISNILISLEDIHTGSLKTITICKSVNRLHLPHLREILSKPHYIALFIDNPKQGVQNFQVIKHFVPPPPRLFGAQSQRSVNFPLTPYETTPQPDMPPTE
jgi:hypothetical protein